jgi:hypothetical protein
MLAAKIVDLNLGDNQHTDGGVSIDTAYDMLNVGERSVRLARKVQRDSTKWSTGIVASLQRGRAC